MNKLEETEIFVCGILSILGAIYIIYSLIRASIIIFNPNYYYDHPWMAVL